MTNLEAISKANSKPSREKPSFSRPDWVSPKEIASMTHGDACPNWMWLSDGYRESIFQTREEK